VNEEALAHWGLSRRKQTYTNLILIIECDPAQRLKNLFERKDLQKFFSICYKGSKRFVVFGLYGKHTSAKRK
jgi:hypothetical protein